MSPQNAVILTPQKRREIIKENILHVDYAKLAKLCNCTERTIKRDVHQWREEGGFEEFLLDEFLRFYPTIKATFPERAFDRLCFLLGKTLTHKMEVKKEIKTEHRTDIHILMERYEEVIKRASERNLQKDNT